MSWLSRRRVATLVAASALAFGTAAGAQAATSSTEAPEATWRVFAVAGDGRTGDTVEDVAATATPAFPADVAVLPSGDVLFSSARTHRVYAVAPSGRLRVVAGDGSTALGGDGGPATAAGLGDVGAIAALPDGGFVLADGPVPLLSDLAPVHPRIRRVAPDGTISTLAGWDTGGFAGDGGPARAARFGDVVALAADADGSILIVDAGVAQPANQRVRRIGPGGIVTTVAGTGKAGYSGDGGPATAADLQGPSDVSPTGDGGFLIADRQNRRVRRVTAGGLIGTVAGTGLAGPGQDGVPAVATELDGPMAVQAAPSGGFWEADALRVRRVGGDGVIRAVTSVPSCRHDDITGPGNAVYAGEGRQARCAAVVANELAVLPDGGLVVADANRTVRLISPAGRGLASVAITSTAILRTSVRIHLLSTVAGFGLVQVRQGARLVRVAQGLTPAGWSTLDVPRPAGAGVHDVRVTVLGTDGSTAAAEVGLQLGRLDPATARAALHTFFAQTGSAPVVLGSCRRFTAARVDCVLRRSASGVAATLPAPCSAVLSVQVRGSGLAGFRAYRCATGSLGPFAAAPRWNTAQWPQRWPPLPRLGLMSAPLLSADG